jgi:hypothetical protein
MNRDQIIAKTLKDMRGYDRTTREEFYQQSAELDEYDRSITIPELMKRLLDSDIMTCKDLDFPVECCDSCHCFYAHYDMDLVDLPDARKAWIGWHGAAGECAWCPQPEAKNMEAASDYQSRYGNHWEWSCTASESPPESHDASAPQSRASQYPLV